LKSLFAESLFSDWVAGLKFLLKRSAEVMPRDSREGRPGPGMTWTALEAVGAAATEVKKTESKILDENFMIEMWRRIIGM
jgi:hypothetical protein